VDRALIERVLAEGRPKAKTMEDGALAPNVANLGLSRGQVAARHRGEGGDFNGLAIRVLEPVRPLLTNVRVAEALESLLVENAPGAIAKLCLRDEVNANGLGQLYGVLELWLEKSGIDVPESISSKSEEVQEATQDWALRARLRPLAVRLEVVGNGRSKAGNPVVPEAWIGRRFESAEALHRAIDGLDWRRGRPAVTYAATYSMEVQEEPTWRSDFGAPDATGTDLAITVVWDPEGERLSTRVATRNGAGDLAAWAQGSGATHFRLVEVEDGRTLLTATSRHALAEAEPSYAKTLPAGVLTSRLQKCIRRGRGCPNLLADATRELARIAPYALPQAQFQRTSGSRQLAWRLFISIVEDCRPYARDAQGRTLSLLDILGLALVAHHDPELQFVPGVFEKLRATALCAQACDAPGENWAWRKGKQADPAFGDSDTADAFSLALLAMPMMQGDRVMLRKGIDRLRDGQGSLAPLPTPSFEAIAAASDPATETAARLASLDFHCQPNLLLRLQASLPFLPHDVNRHTTKKLNRFVWENASRLNTRNPRHKPKKDAASQAMLRALEAIQRWSDTATEPPAPAPAKRAPDQLLSDLEVAGQAACSVAPRLAEAPTPLIARTAFQRLFGRTASVSDGKHTYRVTLAGTPAQPCRVQRKKETLGEPKRGEIEAIYARRMAPEKGSWVKPPPPPPAGFAWVWGDKAEVRLAVVSQDTAGEDPAGPPLKFLADGVELKAFDASPVLRPLAAPEPLPLPGSFAGLVRQTLYLEDAIGSPAGCPWELNLRLRAIAEHRRKSGDLALFDWRPLAEEAGLPAELWRTLYVKLHNNYDDEVQVGPVDREGKRQHNSIHYLYEGVTWRLFNLLAALYPVTIRISGELNFRIDKNTPGYVHLDPTLQALSFPGGASPPAPQASKRPPKVVTPLWDHQRSSRDRFVRGFVQEGRKGFGDASHVGAGKTLTALSVAVELMRETANDLGDRHSAAVVLLPNKQLIATWEEEIRLHTQGLKPIRQESDGKLSAPLTRHSVVLTTLGRMRDKPISHPWLLVVIDECLTVQNKNALQTEEAWRQVVCSRFGVLMMSATFFRSRFDKLYYMLKMLRAGLPEERDFLDAILAETIACHIPKASRNWLTTGHKLDLPATIRASYDRIRASGSDAKTLYERLAGLIEKEHDYLQSFADVLGDLSAERRVLVYAKGKREADRLAERIAGLTRFPDQSGKHVVVSYAEGTYGLNTLVDYDTILTRPPEPDRLPQMKGRLDRPGQTAKQLYLEYVLLRDTIEEAGLLKLEIARTFFNDHILPLADYYDLAVGRKSLEQVEQDLRRGEP
jgi:hypothetical protein